MVHAPPGVYWEWAGSFEQLQQVELRLLVIIPFTLLIIILLIYVNTRSFVKTCIVLLAVPFSLVGCLLAALPLWLSIQRGRGRRTDCAGPGIDAETGVVMLIYLDQAYDERVARGAMNHFNDLIAAVKEGAIQRIRPKMMTMAAILFGLLPIMWSTGSGSEVMKRIAAPMIGGVVTSAILGLLLYPVLYVLWRSREIQANGNVPPALTTGALEPRMKARTSRKVVVGSAAVALLVVAGVAAFFWISSAGAQSDPANNDQSVVIASRTVNGLDVKVRNPRGRTS